LEKYLTIPELVSYDDEYAYVAAAFWNWEITRLARLETADVATESLRTILEACYHTEKCDGNWTTVTAEETLRKNSALNNAGVASALEELKWAMTDTRVTDVLIDPWPVSGRLKMLASRRREAHSAIDLAEAFKNGDRELATKKLDELNALRQTHVSDIEVLSSQETTEAAYKYLVDYAESQRHIALGIGVLDSVIGMLPGGSMTVIGGSTGGGKSQMMLWMAMSMAEAGNRPGIISLEDAREEWGGRIIARMTGVTFRDFAEAKGRPAAERQAIYSRASEAIDRSGQHVFDIAYAISADTASVIDTARRLITERGCNVLFVDYVQAVRIGAEWSKRTDKGVSDVAKRLKGICARLKVPLVLGSQLARSDSVPTIHSLKETGDLENEAEVVILLWRRDDGTKTPPVKWKIGKVKWARERPKGTVLFNRNTGMIEDFVEDDNDDETQKEWSLGTKHAR
jgi:replicative DNA helicase